MVIFGVECVQCGGSFFSCSVIDFVVVGVVIVEKQGFYIWCNFMDIDVYVVDYVDDVFDLFWVDYVVWQMVIDFGVGQVVLFQVFVDQLFDFGLGRMFVGYVVFVLLVREKQGMQYYISLGFCLLGGGFVGLGFEKEGYGIVIDQVDDYMGIKLVCFYFGCVIFMIDVDKLIEFVFSFVWWCGGCEVGVYV